MLSDVLHAFYPLCDKIKERMTDYIKQPCYVVQIKNFTALLVIKDQQLLLSLNFQDIDRIYRLSVNGLRVIYNKNVFLNKFCVTLPITMPASLPLPFSIFKIEFYNSETKMLYDVTKLMDTFDFDNRHITTLHQIDLCLYPVLVDYFSYKLDKVPLDQSYSVKSKIMEKGVHKNYVIIHLADDDCRLF